MWLSYSSSASLLELSPHWAACCLLQQALMCWSVLSWVFGATALLSYPGSVPLNPSWSFPRPQSSKSPFLYLYPSHSSFFRFSPYPLLMTWRSRCTLAFACLWSEIAGITLFPFPREHSWGAPLPLEHCLRISIPLPSLEQKKPCQALLPEHSLLSWCYDAWIYGQSLALLGSSYFFSLQPGLLTHQNWVCSSSTILLSIIDLLTKPQETTHALWDSIILFRVATLLNSLCSPQCPACHFHFLC